MALEALTGWRFRAANFFFLIIVFGLHMFSVPCSKGTCSSPVEVIADYLYSKRLASDAVIKSLIYPSAFLSNEVLLGDNNGFTVPDWDNLLKNFQARDSRAGDSPSLGLGFIIGCGLCLLGAVSAAFGASFISPLGMLIILAYVYKAGNTDPNINFQPMYSVAMFCSLAAFDFSGYFKSKTNRTPTEAAQAPAGKKKSV